MADNFIIDVHGGGTATIAADDAGSRLHQLVKQSVPVDGSDALVRTWATAASMTFAAGAQTLASSSTVGSISDVVDLSQTGYDDLWFEVTAKTAAGSPTAANLGLYVLCSFDGTSFPGDVTYTGSNGSYTLTGASNTANFLTLPSPQMYTGNVSVRRVVSWSQAFPSIGIPAYFSVLVVNNTSLALSTGITVKYRGRY